MTSAKPIPYCKSQIYDQITSEHFTNGTLFEDLEFPANEKSIGSDFGCEIKWMRPQEIVANFPENLRHPEFVVDGASRHDINQGRMGNCWLMAGIAALCENDKLFDKVVDPQQGFSTEDEYCGVFRFRFWRYGDWVEVCIDDFLPTNKGELVFLHSQGSSKNEFWPALFEKAYAKVHGSFFALQGGQPIVAMRDFTGGVTETWQLKKLPDDAKLHPLLMQALGKGALVGCGINPIKGKSGESTLSCGLIAGHAYSLTDAKVINDTKLVRIRNPHGARGVEWNGAWSDDCRFQLVERAADPPEGWCPLTNDVLRENIQSVFRMVKGCQENLVAYENGCCMIGTEPREHGFTSYASCKLAGESFCFGANETEEVKQSIVYKRGSDEWNALDEASKEELGLSLEQDGEFWMSWDDFKKYFDDIQLCNLRAESLDDDADDNIGWKLLQFHGKWTKGVNAGGCRNYVDSFYTNPQIRITLTDIETDDDDMASCLIAIMHKETTPGKRNTFQTYSRGVTIFNCEEQDEEMLRTGEPLPKERFQRKPIATVPFTNARETSKRFLLPPGPYVVVPSAFKPDQEGSFLLRIFAETEIRGEDEDELEAQEDDAEMLNGGV